MSILMQIGVNINANRCQAQRRQMNTAQRSVGHVPSFYARTKLNSLCKENPLLVLFQKCAKPIFEVSDVLMITVEIAPGRRRFVIPSVRDPLSLAKI